MKHIRRLKSLHFSVLDISTHNSFQLSAHFLICVSCVVPLSTLEIFTLISMHNSHSCLKFTLVQNLTIFKYI